MFNDNIMNPLCFLPCLDHCLQLTPMVEVFCSNFNTIEIVEELAYELSGQVVRGVMANFRRRCQACLEASGGAFEYFVD